MLRRGAGFRRTSCQIIVIICGRAVVCCRCCRSLCSLFCNCSCAVPAPATSPHSSSRSIGSWVCRVFSGLCRSSRWSGCRRFGLPARTRAVLERNGPAACFRGCCGAPSAPSGPCYLRGALWSAQEPHVYQKKLVLVRFIILLLSGHSAIRTTGNSRPALPPGTFAITLCAEQKAVLNKFQKHNKPRICPVPSATSRRHPRKATSARRETHEIRRDI